MSIVKNTPHILKHSGMTFTTTLNQTMDMIQDPATLGIYCYLSGKPDDWEISETNLQKRFDRGRDFIRARLAELKLIGLLKTQAVKGRNGRIIRWETTLMNFIPHQITENPSSGETVQESDENHITENPASGKSRRLVDPPTTNKRYKQIKDLNKPPISPKGGLCRFQEFWDIYPKKKARASCEAKWLSNKLDKIADEIINKLRDQVDLDDEWLRGYAPNPSTYLNQRRWNDEISKPKTATALKQKNTHVYDDNDTSWIDEVKI